MESKVLHNNKWPSLSVNIFGYQDHHVRFALKWFVYLRRELKASYHSVIFMDPFGKLGSGPSSQGDQNYAFFRRSIMLFSLSNYAFYAF